jgi:hypothetical protein
VHLPFTTTNGDSLAQDIDILITPDGSEHSTSYLFGRLPRFNGRRAKVKILIRL